jgi:Protein of unknown function (DUF1360)
MITDGGVLFRFVIAALATWRLAFLLARERGPHGVFDWLRHRAGRGLAGELLSCVKCTSFWIAIPFAFFVRGTWTEMVVIWLALAGMAAVIDEWTRPPFEWQETQEPQSRAHPDHDDSARVANEWNQRGSR